MQDSYLVSARGFLFKCYVIHLFHTGNQKFKIKKLKGKGRDQFFIHNEPKVRHIKTVSDLLKYSEENTVIVSDKQNFSAADLFITSHSILQVMVSEVYPVKQAELVNITREWEPLI